MGDATSQTSTGCYAALERRHPSTQHEAVEAAMRGQYRIAVGCSARSPRIHLFDFRVPFVGFSAPWNRRAGAAIPLPEAEGMRSHGRQRCHKDAARPLAGIEIKNGGEIRSGAP
jgi:hypothetical protein